MLRDHSLYGSWGSRSGRYGGSGSSTGIALALFLVLIVVLGGLACNSYYQDSAVTFKLNDKERVAVEGGGEYRLYTEGETFVLKDSIIKGRLDTADEYGRMREGTTYQCKAFGWRIPLFSKFRNVHDCVAVS